MYTGKISKLFLFASTLCILPLIGVGNTEGGETTDNNLIDEITTSSSDDPIVIIFSDEGGGSGSDDISPLRVNECYDPFTDSWGTRQKDMAITSSATPTPVVGNKIFVLRGYSIPDTHYCYDPYSKGKD